MIIKVKNAAKSHTLQRHGNHQTSGMLGLFGNMHADRLPNGMMWPRPDMLGMSAAVKAAMSFPPFGQTNPMQLGKY